MSRPLKHNCIVQITVDEETGACTIQGNEVVTAALERLHRQSYAAGLKDATAIAERPAPVKEFAVETPAAELDRKILSLIRRRGRTFHEVWKHAVNARWVQSRGSERKIDVALQRLKRHGKIFFTKAYMDKPPCWIARPSEKDLRS